MLSAPISYEIEPKIPPSYIEKLYNYIYQKLLIAQKNRFTDVSNKIDTGTFSLEYKVIGSSGKSELKVQIIGNNPMNMLITPLVATISEKEFSKAKEDIDVAIDFFEEQIRTNTLFFAWREGESIIPERVSGKENKSLKRLLLETQILLMALFMGVGFFLFYIVGPLTVVILLALQFMFVFYSSKLIARMADWHITEKNPVIHLLEYPLPFDEHNVLREKIPKNELLKLKKEIYDETISKKGEIDPHVAHGIFSKYGIDLKIENLKTRKVNVFELVKTTAGKFGFPMPEIVVSNAMLPNAAASGPGPSRGVVLITTGLFVQLEDTEIVSVLGHEFGHLKGHDPLWLYGLSVVQYLLWFYVLFGLFPLGSFILFFVYFYAIMTAVYFVAKFFEARADLTSAMVIGQPQILANALEKIGFKKLLFERVPSFRIQEWLSLDPHPPMYFRIARLRKLGPNVVVAHPLIQSAREVTRGFFRSFS